MRLEAFGSVCRVVQQQPGGTSVDLGSLQLRVPGRHNLMNALGATAVGLEAGVSFPRIAAALEEFGGAERRFQMRGDARGVMVVDDYGHHPTEITAVIAAARAGIDRRVLVVFQPHRYSRTSQLLPEFGRALGAADEVVLTEIYAAGETPIEGVTVEAVATAVSAVSSCPVHIVKALDALPAAVAALARGGDLVITLGAGSIGTVADRILAELRGDAPHGRADSPTKAESKIGPDDSSAEAGSGGEAG
jgi:UDP-N-acetylmuramate--alanine ligase